MTIESDNNMNVNEISNKNNNQMKQMENKRKNINNDFVQGDENCYVCRGITYTNDRMVNKKDPIGCFGFKSRGKDLRKDVVINLEKNTKSTNMVWFIGIGTCFWTGRTDRLGKSPIMYQGYERKLFRLDKKDILAKQSNDIPAQQPIDIPAQSKNSPLFIPLAMTFATTFGMSMKRIVGSMYRIVNRSSTNSYTFFNSSKKLILSSSKVMDKSSKILKNRFSQIMDKGTSTSQ